MSGLKKYSPFVLSEMEKAMAGMDSFIDLMDNRFSDSMVKVNEMAGNAIQRVKNYLNDSMKTEKEKYTFIIDVPSYIKKKDLSLEITENNTIKVTGEASDEKVSSKFHYETSLPEDAMADKTEAEYKNGVLYVTVWRKPTEEEKVDKNKILIK